MHIIPLEAGIFGKDYLNIRGSSNGRTVAFEAAYLGSNPGPRAKKDNP